MATLRKKDVRMKFLPSLQSRATRKEKDALEVQGGGSRI
jgi:hypothetical protein